MGEVERKDGNLLSTKFGAAVYWELGFREA